MGRRADFRTRLETAKRTSTAHLLIRCARLVNEYALASLPARDGPRPRAAHMALFPHVALEGGTRVTELATKIGITKQAVGQLVDDMEALGIMTRIADPDDGRAKRVCFTEAGKASMLDGLAHLAQVDDVLRDRVGTTTMDTLHRALLELVDQLDVPDE